MLKGMFLFVSMKLPAAPTVTPIDRLGKYVYESGRGLMYVLQEHSTRVEKDKQMTCLQMSLARLEPGTFRIQVRSVASGPTSLSWGEED
jgi:hypothetical protein